MHSETSRLTSRPAFALVLGSGGIRSAASLGVAKVLWREGFIPDVVAGCSAGAIFGAALCHLNDPEQAKEVATELWTREITQRRRRGAIARMLWPRLGRFDADFSLRDKGEIQERLHRAFGPIRFADLAIELRVRTTDAQSGQPCTLKDGGVVDALLASIAMPFLFSPQIVAGRRYVDGFSSDPLPVSAAQDAIATLAVGFGAPMPERVDTPARLLARTTSSMINNLMHARVESAVASGQNLLPLFPEFDHRVGLFDTHAMADVIRMGERAAQRMLPQIACLYTRNEAVAKA